MKRSGDTVCQICGCAIGPEQAVEVCPEPKCQSLYHRECWDYLGGCARYGCPKMVEVKKSEGDSPTFWGASDKQCPLCAVAIPVGALQCPYCKAEFQDTRPVERDALLRKPEDPIVAGYRKAAVRLLIFSALGVTSPFALLFGGLWYASHRDEIARADRTARALCIIALLICLIYLLLIVVGISVYSLTRR